MSLTERSKSWLKNVGQQWHHAIFDRWLILLSVYSGTTYWVCGLYYILKKKKKRRAGQLLFKVLWDVSMYVLLYFSYHSDSEIICVSAVLNQKLFEH